MTLKYDCINLSLVPNRAVDEIFYNSAVQLWKNANNNFLLLSSEILSSFKIVFNEKDSENLAFRAINDDLWKSIIYGAMNFLSSKRYIHFIILLNL